MDQKPVLSQNFLITFSTTRTPVSATDMRLDISSSTQSKALFSTHSIFSPCLRRQPVASRQHMIVPASKKRDDYNNYNNESKKKTYMITMKRPATNKTQKKAVHTGTCTTHGPNYDQHHDPHDSFSFSAPHSCFQLSENFHDVSPFCHV